MATRTATKTKTTAIPNVEEAEQRLRDARDAHGAALARVGDGDVTALALLELEGDVKLADALLGRARQAEQDRADAERRDHLARLAARALGEERRTEAARILTLAAQVEDAAKALATAAAGYTADLASVRSDLCRLGGVKTWDDRAHQIADGITVHGVTMEFAGGTIAVPPADWPDQLVKQAVRAALVKPDPKPNTPARARLDRLAE